jgi:hypothetical protein
MARGKEQTTKMWRHFIASGRGKVEDGERVSTGDFTAELQEVT